MNISDVVETALRSDLEGQIKNLRRQLDVRERELLLLKGSCTKARCRLHRGHIGPCDSKG